MTASPFSVPAFADELETLAAKVRRSVVAIRSRAGGGAGTAWRADGLVITNHHVVPGDEASVVLGDDRELPARIVARDPAHDLAALRIDAVLEPLEAATTPARAGELVFAVGNPWGFRGAVTAGIVHSVGEPTSEGRHPLESAIRADLRLAPGNSGGPMVDATGKVVGINSMIVGGMAIAVPAAAVLAFVAEGSPARAFLGITARPVPLPPAIAASFGEAGLLLTDVERESPAEASGLIPGDVLLAIDGDHEGIRSVADRLRRMRPGAPLRFELLRGGDLRELDVVPGTAAA
ncbi:MAG TPA: trypsin-like peptidase domain-containing protein [Tepidiformaceae bacterium]|nr:trypsin-like peptidase domain-containing protein [Tepidiformaceae bacterium]